MSIIFEKVAPLLTHEQTVCEERRPRKRPYKARVATKVKWAMRDAMDKTVDAQMRMRMILEWLDEQRRFDAGDATRRARLGDLGHQIAYLALDVSEMERILSRASAECKPEVKVK